MEAILWRPNRLFSVLSLAILFPSLSPSTPAFNGGERRQAEATQWQYVYMAGKEIQRGTQTCCLLDLLLPPFLLLGGFRLNFVSSPFSYSILGGNRKESIIFGIAIKKEGEGKWQLYGFARRISKRLPRRTTFRRK